MTRQASTTSLASAGRKLLDGLVGRTVFAHADRVMGKDPDGGDFHQGAEAQRLAHVVAEYEEAGAESPHPAQHQTVNDGPHRHSGIGFHTPADVHFGRAGGRTS